MVNGPKTPSLLETRKVPVEGTHGESGRSNLKGKNGSIEVREIFVTIRTGLALPGASPAASQTLYSLEKEIQANEEFKEGIPI